MRTQFAKTALRAAAGSIALLLGTGLSCAHAASTVVNLTVQRTSVALPDGANVPMWGYCSPDAPTAATGNTGLGGATLSGGACAATGAMPWTPGPTITVPVGNALTVNLTNKLPTVTSIVILGQLSTDLGTPTKVLPPQHPIQTNATWQNNVAVSAFTPPTQPSRVESFGKEAGAGATVAYTWNALKAGTYLYETGTHPSIQAPMGLYGVIVVTAAPVTAAGATGNLAVPTVTTPGAAYPTAINPANVPYDADAVALLSEIDPVQNRAVDAVAAAAGTGTINEVTGCVAATAATPAVCYPAAVNYTPVYYLLNGKAFDRSNPTASVIGIPQAATTGGALSGNVLIRFANAGLRMHTPSVVGPTMSVIAEDGNLAPGNPKQQTEVILPAGKTIDALLAPTQSATPGKYDLKAYLLFDRALGLSTNNKRDGGGQGYLAVLDANGGTSAAPAPYTALTSMGVATTARAVADSFTIPLNSIAPLNGNVLTNDLGIRSATLGVSPASGTLTFNADGTFIYTPTAAFTSCTPTALAATCPVDSFTYTGNNAAGVAVNTVAVTINVSAASTVVANPDTYNAPVAGAVPAGTNAAVFKAGGNLGGAGVLSNDTDSAGYALTACPPSGCATAPTQADGSWTFTSGAGVAALTVTLHPDGSFVASPATPLATGAPAAPYTFTYYAKNSQGIVSASAATVTVYFAGGTGLNLRLVDAVTGQPFAIPSGLAAADYRWVIEEDRTWHTPIGTALPAGTRSLATSFFYSHMPVVATGCTGPASCQMTGQSIGAVPVAADPTRYLRPDQVVLDPTKWYFVSILPGDAANPIIAGNFADVSSCLSGAVPATSCGHTMGGASIRPGQTAATVPIQPSPLKPAQLSIYIYEDNAPTNGDPDEAELGLGGFEIIVVDVGGRTAGDPVGQVTYDAFNMPLSNALLGQFGCPDTLNQHNDGNDYKVGGAGGQNNGHLTGVVYTCPEPPKNADGSDAGTTGTHRITGVSLAPGPVAGTTTVTVITADNHQLYNGTTVTIGCAANAVCFRGASNLPIPGLTGSFPISATLDGTGTVTSGTSKGFTFTVSAVLSGVVTVDPSATAVDPSQYSLRGQAVIKNLMPGRFDVIAHPGAARQGAGEKWFQVSTLEGTPGQDAFTKANEPVYFQEFGPPGFHTQIGWINPAHIAASNAALNLPPNVSYTNQITGRITNLHMSRPVGETLYDSGSRTPLSHTNCLVALNQTTGSTQVIAFDECDDQGYFALKNIPPGDYQIVAWDTWLDQIIAYKAITVPPQNGQTLAAGDISVFSWFTRVETSMFVDSDGTHKPSAVNTPIAQARVTIRYRDGSLVSIGLTDGNGNAEFAELFPLFNWYVMEADTSRFKPTGVHVVVDAGGKPDTTGDWAGILNSTYLTAPPAYQALPTCGTSVVVTAPCKPAGVGALGTERVDPGSVRMEGLQGFVGQTAMLDYGRTQYAPTENGGIVGHVVFAATRGFDDPRLLVQNLWEPLVPNVTVNLYQKSVNADGSSSLKFAATAKTSSWDDYANATGTTGIQSNLQCPGQLPAPPANTPVGTFPPGTDPYVTWVLGADQFRCYDGFHMWNQIQPAPYDGYYEFRTFTDANGVSTGAPLTTGTYVVEMIPPAGFEVAKEEDKNILIGDAWTSPQTQQFATLANIFILPDQATLNNANRNNPCNGDPNLTSPNGCPVSNGTPGAGIQGNPTYDLGNSSIGDRFWPCVGATHIVPDYLALFPSSAQVAPFAGASKPLCDKKEVVLHNQQQVLADFYIFTETPIAAHFTGLMLDDAASEINAAAPDFGEKFALGYAPVSIKDFNGVEVNRVYTDQWGTFNGLTPSTWQVNVPNPAGYSPNMMITCMNDPGLTPKYDPATGNFLSATGAIVHDPALAPMVKDPQYNAAYSNFCYTNPFMPGMTDYLDTPVLPVSAFASGYNPPDCEYNAGTPAVAGVNGNGLFGPYIDTSIAGPRTLKIAALGDQQVDNPLYQGPAATSLVGTLYGQKTVTRHFGFGAYNAGSAAVLIGANGVRHPLTGLNATTWTDLGITATVPGSLAAGTYQLEITNGQDRLKSVDTVSVTVEDSATATTHVWYVDQANASINGVCPAAAPRLASTIQDAINCAAPGDLILINAGLYNELVVMWKPVRLQGIAAASVTIQAAKYPTNKLEAWRPIINTLFGVDPNTGNTAGVTQVDLLPNQNTGAVVLLEPTILNTEEGPGIAVLSKGYRRDGSTPLTAADCVAAGANTYLDPSKPGFAPVPDLSNFLCGASRIDGLAVTGGDSGGGIYVNGWAHNIEISNNRVFGNAGQSTGGIRVGTPNLEAQGSAPANGYGYNLNVRVHNNSITKNGTVEPAGAGAAAGGSAGAGLTMSSGSDNYLVAQNWVCGNFSSSDGGGIGHIGASMNAHIASNTIIFNQSYNQSSTVNGGGLVIAGEQPGAGALSNGVGNLLVDSNLILGNFAEAGHGGGIRVQQANGMDVVNNPTNTPGLIGADGAPLPTWYTVTITNNTIVDNVAGWSGGGISLADAVSVKIVNNTIAYNDSTGIVGVLMLPSPVTGQPSPAGVSAEMTSTALATASGKPFSAPVLDDDIIVHNRSFFFDASGTSASGNVLPQLCSSNVVTDASATAASHACTTIAPATTAGQCGATVPAGAVVAYWDLGVLGDQSMAAPGAFRLAPTYTIVSQSNLAPYAGSHNQGPSDAALNLVKPYCNGPRANPGLQFEPGQPFLPPFQMSATATLDEAGNFVDLRYGPLSLSDPLAANPATVATLYSDYTFSASSVALNSGNDIGVTNHDRFGTLRPQGPAFDIGSYEQVVAGRARSVSPLALAFGDVVAGTTSAYQTVTVTNSGTVAFTPNFAFSSPRYGRAPAPNAGTCGGGLAAGASCTYNVRFAPIAVGAVNATLTVGGFGGGLPAEVVSLTGAGISGSLRLAPTTLAFGTLPALTPSAIETITVTNTGSAAVQLAATNGVQVTAPVAANAAMYAVDQTSTCANGQVLQPAQTCTVALVFTPATVGPHPATLNVRYVVPPGAAVVTVTAALTGTGVAATNAVVDPTAVAFGQVQIGTTSAAQTVTINNVTAANITLNAIALIGPNANQFVRPAGAAGGTCAAGAASPILPGGACTINLAMAATAPAGLKTATLQVTHSGAGAPYAVALSGVAQAQSLALSPIPLLMGPQTIGMASPPQAITLTNTGVGPLTLRGIAISNGAVFSINGAPAGSCSTTTAVAVGGTCAIRVVATPAAAVGYNATVTVAYGPVGTPAVTDAVSASGVAASAALLPQAGLNFGYQQVATAATAQAVSIVNTGLGPLQVTGAALAGGTAPGDYAILAPSCVGFIPAGGNCAVNIGFTPRAIGTRQTNLNVTFGAGVPAQSVVLTGVGITPASTGLVDPATGAAVTAATLAFGSQPLNTASAPRLVLLANTGSGALPVGTIQFTGATPNDFSQTNTCGTRLIVGATCQIYVTYNPVTAVGPSSATLAVTVPGVAAPITAPASGTATAAAAATLTPAALAFPVTQTGTSSAALNLVLASTSASALPIRSIAVSGPNAKDFGQTNNCGAGIAGSATCTITVTFTPSVPGTAAAPGSESATLTVVDGGGTQTVALSGTSQTPSASLTAPAALTSQVGSPGAPVSVTLTNSGTGPETVSAVVIGGTNAKDFTQTNTCVTTPTNPAIPGAGTCTITVTLTASVAGAEAATLTVTDTAGQQSVALNGTGSPASVTVVPSTTTVANTLSFPNTQQGVASSLLTATLTNTGIGPETVTSVAITGANAADFTQTSTCVTSSSNPAVAPGATCVVTVTFRPSAAAAETATLTLIDTAGTQTVSLTGTGVAPKIAIANGATALTPPGPVAFGNSQVGTAAAAVGLTVTNVGLAADTLSTVTVSATNASDFVQTNTCTTTAIAVNGTCTITLTFTPTATPAGAETAVLTITDSVGTQTVLTMNGTGVAPVATLGAPSASPSSQQAVAAAPFTVTLSNGGIGPETVASVTFTGANAADFAQTNTCSAAAVAPAGTCVITVTFTPSTVGAETATLNVTDTAGTQTATLSGTGVAPSATATPAVLAFAATAAGTSSAAQTVTVQNTGLGPITVLAPTYAATSGAPTDFVVTSNCPSSLAAGLTCTVSAVFAPATGELSTSVDGGTVTIGGTVPLSVSVSGTVQ